MKTIRGILSHIDFKVVNKIQVCLTGINESGFDDSRTYKTDMIWFYDGDIVVDDWFLSIDQNGKIVLMVFIDDEEYYYSKIEFWNRKLSLE